MKTFLLTCFLVVAAGFFWFLFKDGHETYSEGDLAAARVNAKTMKQFEKEYGLRASAVRVGGPNKIQKIGIGFHCYNHFGKEQARKLILDCADKYLTNINTDESLRPELCCYPFTDKNIDLTIYFRNQDGRKFFYPNLGGIYIDNKINYITNGENSYQFKFYVEEPISLARAIVADPALAKKYDWNKEVQVQAEVESVIKPFWDQYKLWNIDPLILRYDENGAVELILEFSFIGYSDMYSWRKLIVEAVEESLEKLNRNKEVRELFGKPLTSTNFKIKFNAQPPGEEWKTDNVTIRLENGLILYKREMFQPYKLVDEESESYSEAVEKVQGVPILTSRDQE